MWLSKTSKYTHVESTLLFPGHRLGELVDGVHILERKLSSTYPVI